MLLSREEAEARLRSNGNLAREEKKEPASSIEMRPMWNGGRNVGDTNLPPFLKEIIGTLAYGQPAREVAEAFQVSQCEVYDVKHAHSGADRTQIDKELRQRIDDNLGRIRDVAMTKLMNSLNLLTDAKIGAANARDISNVAANMAKVVEKTLPQAKDREEGSKLIIYAPTINTETNYRTVEIAGTNEDSI